VLLIGGAGYTLRPPQNEAELHSQVKEHSKNIFGADSAYLDLKQKLRSEAGVGSIPDGYVLTLGKQPSWCIVEVELSSHPLFAHVTVQVTKFVNGIKNPTTRTEIVNAMDEEIGEDDELKAWIKNKTGQEEIYRFLSKLIASPPLIVIVIDEKTDELQEVCTSLPGEKRVLEFKTFLTQGSGPDSHAHLYQPLTTSSDCVTVTLQNGPFMKFHRLRIPQNERTLFPGYKLPFKIETDIGDFETCVRSASKGTQIGDRLAGRYVEVNLTPWLEKHPEMKVGDPLVITAIEPMKRYSLTTP
jgi:hypothetical protein